MTKPALRHGCVADTIHATYVSSIANERYPRMDFLVRPSAGGPTDPVGEKAPAEGPDPKARRPLVAPARPVIRQPAKAKHRNPFAFPAQTPWHSPATVLRGTLKR